jgi:hypothetical protein
MPRRKNLQGIAIPELFKRAKSESLQKKADCGSKLGTDRVSIAVNLPDALNNLMCYSSLKMAQQETVNNDICHKRLC